MKPNDLSAMAIYYTQLVISQQSAERLHLPVGKHYMRLGNKTYHFKEKMEIVAAYAGNKRRPSIKGYVRSWQTLNTKKN